MMREVDLGVVLAKEPEYGLLVQLPDIRLDTKLTAWGGRGALV